MACRSRLHRPSQRARYTTHLFSTRNQCSDTNLAKECLSRSDISPVTVVERSGRRRRVATRAVLTGRPGPSRWPRLTLRHIPSPAVIDEEPCGMHEVQPQAARKLILQAPSDLQTKYLDSRRWSDAPDRASLRDAVAPATPDRGINPTATGEMSLRDNYSSRRLDAKGLHREADLCSTTSPKGG